MPGGIVVLELIGEVDLASEDAMRSALFEAAELAGLRVLVCDLSEVGFFGCGGLTILQRCRAALSERDIPMIVLVREPLVVMVFEITGLTGRLRVHVTRDAAN